MYRYAEVLEHTQYALIATVHKLYDMLRRGEEWTYGEPELNDRGLPVIHNIAEKLGCIRQAPDVNYTFPEGEEDFLELQQRLQASASLDGGENGKLDSSQDFEHTSDRTERASSSESEHSVESKDCSTTSQNQQPSVIFKKETESHTPIKQEHTSTSKLYHQAQIQPIQIPRPAPMDFSRISNVQQQQTSPRSAFTSESMSSFGSESPFTEYALASDDFLGPPPALDITAQYLNTRQQQAQQQKSQQPQRFSFSQSIPYNLNIPATAAQPDFTTNCAEVMNANYYTGMTTGLGDGTIRPGMLEGGMPASFDFDRMDGGDMMFDYVGEGNLMMAS